MEPRDPHKQRDTRTGLWALVVFCLLIYLMSMPCCFDATAGPPGYFAIFAAVLMLAKLERMARPGRVAYRCFAVFIAMIFIYRFWADVWIDSGVVGWMKRRAGE